jgi:hypothetical protein
LRYGAIKVERDSHLEKDQTMSVVAKVNVNGLRSFGAVTVAQIGCVCDDRLMTIRDPATTPGKVSENQTFNTASPWGDGLLTIKGPVPLHEREELYLIFQRGDGRIRAGAIVGFPIRCASITDFGGTSKQVEWTNSQRLAGLDGEPLADSAHVDGYNAFNLKMSIDNPAASMQFDAGSDDGWLYIYRASEYSLQEALDLAHGAD